MIVGKLTTALSVIFVVFLVALAGELIYVLWRHRSFRRRSSPAPHLRSRDETPNFSVTDVATKELLYFFCLKPHTSVELGPPEAPNKNKDGSSPDDQVVDVLDLLDASGASKFPCTINEEDKEVESKPDVDFSSKPATKNICLESSLQSAGQPAMAEVEEEVVSVTVDRDDGNTNTVFSTPCDSPMFFTPAGSPSRDFIESEFVVSVHITGNSDDR